MTGSSILIDSVIGLLSALESSGKSFQRCPHFQHKVNGITAVLMRCLCLWHCIWLSIHRNNDNSDNKPNVRPDLSLSVYAVDSGSANTWPHWPTLHNTREKLDFLILNTYSSNSGFEHWFNACLSVTTIHYYDNHRL